MRARLLSCWVCSLVALTLTTCGGERVREAPVTSALGGLKGRCVVLSHPLFLIPGRDEEFVDGYLAEANNRSGTGQVLQPGDRFVVQRVILKRAFDGRYAIVVGRCTARYMDRKVALFLLFSPEWTRRAEDAAFAGSSQSPGIDGGTLAADRATWCR
jgi:hypothetical protein